MAYYGQRTPGFFYYRTDQYGNPLRGSGGYQYYTPPTPTPSPPAEETDPNAYKPPRETGRGRGTAGGFTVDGTVFSRVQGNEKDLEDALRKEVFGDRPLTDFVFAKTGTEEKKLYNEYNERLGRLRDIYRNSTFAFGKDDFGNIQEEDRLGDSMYKHRDGARYGGAGRGTAGFEITDKSEFMFNADGSLDPEFLDAANSKGLKGIVEYATSNSSGYSGSILATAAQIQQDKQREIDANLRSRFSVEELSAENQNLLGGLGDIRDIEAAPISRVESNISLTTPIGLNASTTITGSTGIIDLPGDDGDDNTGGTGGTGGGGTTTTTGTTYSYSYNPNP